MLIFVNPILLPYFPIYKAFCEYFVCFLKMTQGRIIHVLIYTRIKSVALILLKVFACLLTEEVVVDYTDIRLTTNLSYFLSGGRSGNNYFFQREPGNHRESSQR